MAEDRVLAGANDGRQYRVVAGSAFSWAYLLIEDRLGERFILDTDQRALAPVSDLEAAGLLESRSYREWNGPQRWLTVMELAQIDGRAERQDQPVLPQPVPDTFRVD